MVQVWHTLLTHYQEAEKNIFQGLVRELKKLDFSRLIPLYGITNPALPSSLFFFLNFFFYSFCRADRRNKYEESKVLAL